MKHVPVSLDTASSQVNIRVHQVSVVILQLVVWTCILEYTCKNEKLVSCNLKSYCFIDIHPTTVVQQYLLYSQGV